MLITIKFDACNEVKIYRILNRGRAPGAPALDPLFENINRNFSGISDRPWIETFPNSAGKPREVAIVENIFHSCCLLRTTKPLLAFEQGGMFIEPHRPRVFSVRHLVIF